MRLLPFFLVLLWAAPLLAAPPLETARAQATEAREAVGALTRQQLSLRAQLGQLSGRIEALKAEGGRRNAGELDGALKQSQALSATLTALAQQLSTLSRRSEEAHLMLHTALAQELVRLRSLFTTTVERPRRATLLAQMRALRAEQERVRPLLPAAVMPPLPQGAGGGDDPEDLLEQVDALRDFEDRVRAQLAQVEARLREARAEQELSRRMDDFLGAEALFDEQDRQLRGGTTRASVDAPRGGGNASDPPSAPSAGPPGGPPDAPSRPGQDGLGLTLPNSLSASEGGGIAIRLGAQDPRPLVGQVRPSGLAAEELQSVAGLEALKKRLAEQAHSYGQRAKELEQRARELQ